jgi:hypothetical protein
VHECGQAKTIGKHGGGPFRQDLLKFQDLN